MKPIGISKLYKKHLGDWGVNIYNGCEHGCAFCYAPAQPGVRAQPFWVAEAGAGLGRFYSERDGLVDALRKQLCNFTPARAVKTAWGQGRILVSFLCDAYQPMEEKLGVTRQVQIGRVAETALQLYTSPSGEDRLGPGSHPGVVSVRCVSTDGREAGGHPAGSRAPPPSGPSRPHSNAVHVGPP